MLLVEELGLFAGLRVITRIGQAHDPAGAGILLIGIAPQDLLPEQARLLPLLQVPVRARHGEQAALGEAVAYAGG